MLRVQRSPLKSLPPARWEVQFSWAEPIRPGRPRLHERIRFHDPAALLDLLRRIEEAPDRPLRRVKILRVIGGRPRFIATVRAVSWDAEKRRRKRAAKLARRSNGGGQ